MQRTPVSLHRPASKPSKRQRSRKRRRSKGNDSNREKFTRLMAQMPSTSSHSHRNHNLDIWRRTYENLAKWHIQHQTEFWRTKTELLSRENSKLKEQLVEARSSLKASGEEYTESSDSDEEDDGREDNESEIDEKYLEFLEVTRKHQKEVQETKQGNC